ncbi:MAG: GerW family sporulation protein [Lachnospiraceae bacterium]|nr:GerW family sporulation protein [Lachnospiraceae bacterium]
MADNKSDINSFKGTVESLFSGLDSFVSTKTVVGEAVNIGGTILLPLVDVSFGMGAGSFNGDKSGGAGGGMGAKIEPTAVLVIQNGNIKLVNVKNQDGITKILDMVPDFVDKFTKKAAENAETKEAKTAAADDLSKKLEDAVN